MQSTNRPFQSTMAPRSTRSKTGGDAASSRDAQEAYDQGRKKNKAIVQSRTLGAPDQVTACFTNVLAMTGSSAEDLANDVHRVEKNIRELIIRLAELLALCDELKEEKPTDFRGWVTCARYVEACSRQHPQIVAAQLCSGDLDLGNFKESCDAWANAQLPVAPASAPEAAITAAAAPPSSSEDMAALQCPMAQETSAVAPEIGASSSQQPLESEPTCTSLTVYDEVSQAGDLSSEGDARTSLQMCAHPMPTRAPNRPKRPPKGMSHASHASHSLCSRRFQGKADSLKVEIENFAAAIEVRSQK